MLELIEANPLPEACRNCPDEFCDECDYMGLRWPLSHEDARRLERKARERAISRLLRELEQMKDKSRPAQSR